MAAANDLDNAAKPWTVDDLIGHVRLVIPDITEDVLNSLLLYIKSAGVTSEADIDKIEARKLSAIVGAEDAIALLDYFRKQALISKKPLCHVDTSPTAAAPQAPAIAPVGGVSQDMVQIFKMVLEMQNHNNEQNRKVMTDMQTSQKDFLGSVKDAMAETASMVKGTLDTVKEQITAQATMQQQAIAAMQQNTESAAAMNRAAMSAVELNMQRTCKMNSETTQLVHKSIVDVLEQQRKTAEKVEKMSQEAAKNECVIQ
ncbi:uncharacterized protein LOC142581954 [Dermacentor variabilis]|uniref:uncharacterized protein LOC142581954 n=1 Tax=Dermacentor variabilis TaxID=34621 RepID=UPI003F5B4966